MEALESTERELHIRRCADDIVEQLTDGAPVRIRIPRISDTGEHLLLQDDRGCRDVSEFAKRVEETIQERHNRSVRVTGNCLNMNILLTGFSRTSTY
jgi:hypothetical protein